MITSIQAQLVALVLFSDGIFSGIYIAVSPSADQSQISYCVEDMEPSNQYREKFQCDTTIFGQFVNISFPDSIDAAIKFREIEVIGY